MIDNIYYFQVDVSCGEDVCANLAARNRIDGTLRHFGFQYVDMSGGQAAYYPGMTIDRLPIGEWGRPMSEMEPCGEVGFRVFKIIVELASSMYGINVTVCKHCNDPGLGLMMPEGVEYKAGSCPP